MPQLGESKSRVVLLRQHRVIAAQKASNVSGSVYRYDSPTGGPASLNKQHPNIKNTAVVKSRNNRQNTPTRQATKLTITIRSRKDFSVENTKNEYDQRP